jgi:tetratricopeptide (TPR) repeat protein
MSNELQTSSQWKAMYCETLVAAASYQEAITYWQQNPDLHLNAQIATLEQVVIALREIGQFEQADEVLNQALQRSDLTEQERVGLLEQQANAAIMRGELSRAYDLLGEIAEQAKKLEMLDSLTVFLYNRANIGRVLGHYQAARESITQALELTAQAGHVVRGAWMQNILGMLQTDLGDYQAAETTLLEARDVHLRQNFPSAISGCAEILTRLYCVWQQPYSALMARKYSLEALHLERKEQTPLSLPLGFMGVAEVELKFGSPTDALNLCNQAFTVVKERAVAPLEASVYLLRGRIYHKLGNTKAPCKT